MQRRRWIPHVSLMLALLVCINLMAILSPVSARSEKETKQSYLDSESKLSPDVAALAHDNTAISGEEVRVIVQTRASRARFDETINSKGGRVRRQLPLVGGYVAEVSCVALSDLASDGDTVYVSLDRKTRLAGSARYDRDLVRITTGAENVVGNTGLAGNDKETDAYFKSLPAGPNGKGIAIAVLDSGIYDDGALHEDLRSVGNVQNRRVLLHKNFVSSETLTADQLNRGYDPYGHGTHVAGIAAGSGRECIQDERIGNFYAGVAFNANLLDLRVIGSDGTGYISDAIAAIDWMVANRKAYNIRVANFSIGANVTQSYKTDPFCQAVERAHQAGIVCVVAAGNFGKDSAGNPVYGSILAPGNDPFVITVGATNTFGTVTRSDDVMATYSSRGPALVDFVVKPDLVAPGNLIRSIAAEDNYLARTHGLAVHDNGGRYIYMSLSGTSMSAPVVAGTAALMLDANPSLTPAMVKSILQFTAQPLASLEGTSPLVRMLTEGAGSLNADAAVRMAQAFVSNADTRPDGSELLKDDKKLLDEMLYNSQTATGAFTSNIAGETVSWGDHAVYSQGIAYIYTRDDRQLVVFKTAGWQISPGFILTNGYLATSSRLAVDSRLAADSRLTADSRLIADSRLTADSRIVADSRLIADSRITADSRVVADGWLYDEGANEMTNPAAARSIWSANLLDQTASSHGATSTDSRVIADSIKNVMTWGDEAPGFQITTIESKRHPLYPRGQKIKD